LVGVVGQEEDFVVEASMKTRRSTSFMRTQRPRDVRPGRRRTGYRKRGHTHPADTVKPFREDHPARTGERTVRSDTKTVTINARPKDVLGFVGDGANLPRWAIGFAKSVRSAGLRWIVTTSQGEVPTTVTVDESCGTVDFRMEPASGNEAIAYARAVPNGFGTEFVFTQLQQPEMPDELFDQLSAAVGHELAALKALLEVECPL